MPIITRKKGSFDDLVFTVDLSDYGKTGADVSDISFSVKEHQTDLDDSLLLRTLVNGDVSFSGTSELVVAVTWPSDQYSQFKVGKKYQAGLFIKWVGDALHDENVDTIWDLEITQDFLHS
jgi:hypothetical protein